MNGDETSQTHAKVGCPGMRWDDRGGGRAPQKPFTTEDTEATEQEWGNRKTGEINRKGHPFDSPFASSGSLRAGCGTQRKLRKNLTADKRWWHGSGIGSERQNLTTDQHRWHWSALRRREPP